MNKKRIRTIFLSLLFLFLITSVSFLYTGIVSGKFEESLITPTVSFLESVERSFEKERESKNSLPVITPTITPVTDKTKEYRKNTHPVEDKNIPTSMPTIVEISPRPTFNLEKWKQEAIEDQNSQLEEWKKESEERKEEWEDQVEQDREEWRQEQEELQDQRIKDFKEENAIN